MAIEQGLWFSTSRQSYSYPGRGAHPRRQEVDNSMQWLHFLVGERALLNPCLFHAPSHPGVENGLSCTWGAVGRRQVWVGITILAHSMPAWCATLGWKTDSFAPSRDRTPPLVCLSIGLCSPGLPAERRKRKRELHIDMTVSSCWVMIYDSSLPVGVQRLYRTTHNPRALYQSNCRTFTSQWCFTSRIAAPLLDQKTSWRFTRSTRACTIWERSTEHASPFRTKEKGIQPLYYW